MQNKQASKTLQDEGWMENEDVGAVIIDSCRHGVLPAEVTKRVAMRSVV